MVFSSLIFMFLYLTVVMAVYYLIPRKWRNTFLMIANIVFYGYGEPIYIILMMFSITMNYLFGIWIDKRRDKPSTMKLLLIINVILNLGMLGFFKYAGFFVETLSIIPIFSNLVAPEIALPIGISFYTFQTMSYTIDVYRGDCPSQKDYIAFATYVCLFPQLIAGPIVRYVDVADQLVNRRENFEQFNNGVKLFLVGLAKKVLLGNQMGAMWTAIKPMEDAGILGSWAGIIAFTLQIYFDFSGYSDMARGLGNMFGFEFLKNFDFPYISKSITEFWRRWHMSLGTWFREYVYIPLGGNRKGMARQVLNLFVVWFLTGMWHGASWNFILWGLYFGVLLVIEKFVILKLLKKIPAVFSHIYALFFIVIGWVIFDFIDLGEMFTFIGNMFSLSNGIISADAKAYLLSYLPLMIVGILVSTPLPRKIFLKLSSMKYGAVLETVTSILVIILSVASLVSNTYNPFLYFRF